MFFFKTKVLAFLIGTAPWTVASWENGTVVSAEPASASKDAPADPLARWRSGVKVSAVSAGDYHSIHSYFNTSPESPDGRWVLYYASTAATGYEGEIRIRARATGQEIVLARGVAVEDAHRAACQQWVCGGRSVVFHNVLSSGEWVVVAVEIKTGNDRIMARGRQVSFGQPAHDLVPLYGPHYSRLFSPGLDPCCVWT